jgi:hypothetical protein
VAICPCLILVVIKVVRMVVRTCVRQIPGHSSPVLYLVGDMYDKSECY